MPLLDFYPLPQHEGYIGIWEIEEEESFFLNRLDLHPEEASEVKNLKGGRKLEWLSARYLLNRVVSEPGKMICSKDSAGKPFLVNSAWYISISHSHNRTAVIYASRPVGIDIQLIVPKIERIGPKYLSEQEWQWAKKSADFIEVLHLFWGAKEAVYKANGKKGVEFSQNIIVPEHHYTKYRNNFEATLLTDSTTRIYQVFGKCTEQFMLVWCIEKD